MPKRKPAQIAKSKSMKNPSRRIRSRTRKPKFLSLLLLDSSPESSDLADKKMTHQLNLFPLHPENSQIEEKDLTYLFTSDPPSNLTGILNSGDHDDRPGENVSSEENSVFSQTLTYPRGGTLILNSGAGNVSSEENSVFSQSLSRAYGGMDSEESISLVRTAMRSRERDRSEEKWVCYSEVVEERKKVEEEVTSCRLAADEREKGGAGTEYMLSLKLDYDEILNAWSDKGSLYVVGLGGSQIVPEFDDHQISGFDSVMSGGLWSVPENTKIVPKTEDEELKIAQREASVLRYKLKRQSRLFSKRIRYEVRKVNAEKRPRMKGRFVKRS